MEPLTADGQGFYSTSNNLFGNLKEDSTSAIYHTDNDKLMLAKQTGLSRSEFDDLDWSIEWLEPLGLDFESNDNDEDDSGDYSFAVLVPCYSPGCKEVEDSNNVLLRLKIDGRIGE
ncbi:hypothetical protein L195_g024462 [Trifolium pratense]|uniref:Uncharacterized protein n=1 Tax=Trifolium pratense TaxID=57577 RepID=A0A2K3NDS8_TRIPR|nr:hypothetical protein L195_g024462 [Trifolium pratense]